MAILYINGFQVRIVSQITTTKLSVEALVLVLFSMFRNVS